MQECVTWKANYYIALSSVDDVAQAIIFFHLFHLFVLITNTAVLLYIQSISEICRSIAILIPIRGSNLREPTLTKFAVYNIMLYDTIL